MSLYSEFNNLIKLSGKASPNEVDLFTFLKQAISSSFPNSFVKTYHKHCVSFTSTAGTNEKCEISDLLLIVISPTQGRFTFLQNKYSHSMDPRAIIKADMIQYDLLHHHLFFKPLCTGLNGDILINSYPYSSTSYGDFFIDKTNQFDMRFFLANDLYPHIKYHNRLLFHKKPKRIIRLLSSTHKVRNVNSIKECVYCDGLIDLEKNINQMIMGSPFWNDNKRPVNWATSKALLSIAYSVINDSDNSDLKESHLRLLENIMEKHDIRYVNEANGYAPSSVAVIFAK